MERDPYSQLTREVLSKRGNAAGRRILIDKISRFVYSYPKKHLHWDDDDTGDFFCVFYPKIEGLIDRFTFQGKPFEAYLVSSIRWQMKTFAKKRVMQHSEHRAIKDESDFWQKCGAPENTNPDGGVYYSPDDQTPEVYSAEVSRVLKIESRGKISDPAWARRLLYLMLRSVTFVDDSLMEHTARLCGFDPGYILGCATELRQRLDEKRERQRVQIERRNSLHVRILQLTALMSDETDADRLEHYRKRLTAAKARIDKTNRDLRSMPVLPTHKDIAEVLETAKGSVDSGLYYLMKAFKNIGLN
ncbi:MAG: hypothetical protein JW852_04930 [Spirochaetales bacterium]|nr:hypothetical protein [Spirochaetales bacterium]